MVVGRSTVDRVLFTLARGDGDAGPPLNPVYVIDIVDAGDLFRLNFCQPLPFKHESPFQQTNAPAC